MSNNFDREPASHLACNVTTADLSERDLETVTAGKSESPEGKRDLEERGPLSSMAAFAQMRYEFWSQFGLAGRRSQG